MRNRTANHRFGGHPGTPNARAVLGGSLVALAVIGVFLLADGRGSEPELERVVAARDIEPGSVIEPEDLDTARLRLPAGVDRATFDEPGLLVGSTVLGPVGEGELIQRTSVLAGSADTDAEQRPELSLTLDADRALGGGLRSGERVDVVATYGSGGNASTRLAASGAVVVRVTGAQDRTLGPVGTVTVTLSVGADDVLAVAHAAEAGGMRLVRAAGTDGPPAETYRAEGSGDLDEPSGSTDATTSTGSSTR